MHTLALACVLLALAPADEGTPTLRLIDLDGDGRLDRLEHDADGSLRFALNRGRREFEPIVQSLPAVVVTDVLSADLNGDGSTDLYLVSKGANVALVGDGTGRFVEATLELGLADPGEGSAAELVDIDADGVSDVLLHNTHGDVIFWGAEMGAFERDAGTPVVSLSAAPVPALVSQPVPDAVPVPVPGALPDAGRTSGPGARRAVASPPAGGTRSVTHTPPGIEPAMELPYCANSIEDQASGACILADSTPTLGRLYPLGQELSITPLGSVGINTTTPATTLEVNGSLRAAGSFNVTSTGDVGIGTDAPEARLHVVGDSTLGSLRISPAGAQLNRDAELVLSEGGPGGPLCEWSIYYDGSNTNQLQFRNACAIPSTPLAIVRDSIGTVLVGTTDTATSFAGPGRLRVNGDVSQVIAAGGFVKAAAHVDGVGTVATTRSFNHLPGALGSSVTVTDLGVGRYEVSFGADIRARYYLATVGTGVAGNAPDGTIEVTPRSGNANALFVECRDGAGVPVDTRFFVLIY